MLCAGKGQGMGRKDLLAMDYYQALTKHIITQTKITHISTANDRAHY